ncbi:unnamed protein product [Closterium sp. NIES-64]|nr:unnamed protein product [Closterium sp. NIES-64]
MTGLENSQKGKKARRSPGPLKDGPLKDGPSKSSAFSSPQQSVPFASNNSATTAGIPAVTHAHTPSPRPGPLAVPTLSSFKENEQPTNHFSSISSPHSLSPFATSSPAVSAVPVAATTPTPSLPARRAASPAGRRSLGKSTSSGISSGVFAALAGAIAGSAASAGTGGSAASPGSLFTNSGAGTGGGGGGVGSGTCSPGQFNYFVVDSPSAQQPSSQSHDPSHAQPPRRHSGRVERPSPSQMTLAKAKRSISLNSSRVEGALNSVALNPLFEVLAGAPRSPESAARRDVAPGSGGKAAAYGKPAADLTAWTADVAAAAAAAVTAAPAPAAAAVAVYAAAKADAEGEADDEREEKAGDSEVGKARGKEGAEKGGGGSMAQVTAQPGSGENESAKEGEVVFENSQKPAKGEAEEEGSTDKDTENENENQAGGGTRLEGAGADVAKVADADAGDAVRHRSRRHHHDRDPQQQHQQRRHHGRHEARSVDNGGRSGSSTRGSSWSRAGGVLRALCAVVLSAALFLSAHRPLSALSPTLSFLEPAEQVWKTYLSAVPGAWFGNGEGEAGSRLGITLGNGWKAVAGRTSVLWEASEPQPMGAFQGMSWAASVGGKPGGEKEEPDLNTNDISASHGHPQICDGVSQIRDSDLASAEEEEKEEGGFDSPDSTGTSSDLVVQQQQEEEEETVVVAVTTGEEAGMVTEKQAVLVTQQAWDEVEKHEGAAAAVVVSTGVDGKEGGEEIALTAGGSGAVTACDAADMEDADVEDADVEDADASPEGRAEEAVWEVEQAEQKLEAEATATADTFVAATAATDTFVAATAATATAGETEGTSLPEAEEMAWALEEAEQQSLADQQQQMLVAAAVVVAVAAAAAVTATALLRSSRASAAATAAAAAAPHPAASHGLSARAGSQAMSLGGSHGGSQLQGPAPSASAGERRQSFSGQSWGAAAPASGAAGAAASAGGAVSGGGGAAAASGGGNVGFMHPQQQQQYHQQQQHQAWQAPAMSGAGGVDAGWTLSEGARLGRTAGPGLSSGHAAAAAAAAARPAGSAISGQRLGNQGMDSVCESTSNYYGPMGIRGGGGGGRQQQQQREQVLQAQQQQWDQMKMGWQAGGTGGSVGGSMGGGMGGGMGGAGGHSPVGMAQMVAVGDVLVAVGGDGEGEGGAQGGTGSPGGYGRYNAFKPVVVREVSPVVVCEVSRDAGRQGGREAGRQGGREAGRQGGREAGRQGGTGSPGGYGRTNAFEPVVVREGSEQQVVLTPVKRCSRLRMAGSEQQVVLTPVKRSSRLRMAGSEQQVVLTPVKRSSRLRMAVSGATPSVSGFSQPTSSYAGGGINHGVVNRP